jgi:hypothetical protein
MVGDDGYCAHLRTGSRSRRDRIDRRKAIRDGPAGTVFPQCPITAYPDGYSFCRINGAAAAESDYRSAAPLTVKRCRFLNGLDRCVRHNAVKDVIADFRPGEQVCHLVENSCTNHPFIRNDKRLIPGGEFFTDLSERPWTEYEPAGIPNLINPPRIHGSLLAFIRLNSTPAQKPRQISPIHLKRDLEKWQGFSRFPISLPFFHIAEQGLVHRET